MTVADRLITLAEAVKEREEEERQKRERGEGTSPLSVALQGGSAAGSLRPWSFLTAEDLEELGAVSELLPWSENAEVHLNSRLKRNLVTGVLQAVIEGNMEDPDQVEELLNERRQELEAIVDEYEFLFPVDNLQISRDLKIHLGNASVVAHPEDAWRRFCGETWSYAKDNYDDRSAEKAGSALANDLLGEENLRSPTKGELPPAVVKVVAHGSPNSAYQRAREDAHFALACITFFNSPWSERAGQFIALEGEGFEQGKGWRVRFAGGQLGPEIRYDGHGSGLPIKIEELNEQTQRFYDELDNIASDPSPYGRRLLRAIHWTGEAMNVPVLTREEEDEPADQIRKEALKPTGFEICRRLTSLITALEAVLKRDDNETRTNVLPRVENLLNSLQTTPSAGDLRAKVDDAYDARNQCTHEGHGDPGRHHVEIVRQVLQILVPNLVLIGNEGLQSFDDLERLCDNAQPGEEWRETLQRTA